MLSVAKRNKVLTKRYVLISLLMILFLVIFNNCSTQSDEVLAKVGSHKITSDEFIKRYTDYIVVSGINDNLRARIAILNNMVSEILLKEYDDNSSVYNNEEYKVEKEWARKQALLAYLKDKEAYAGIKVTEADLREAFVKANQRIEARHLYAKTKEEADELYSLLQAGADFNLLARQVFTDSTLKNNGGYLGYFSWGDMDPVFEDTAFALPVGGISKPVNTSQGYSIIKVEDKEYNPILTEYDFLNKKSHMERMLKLREKKPAERKFLESIYNKDELSIYDDGLKEALDFLYQRNLQSEADLKYDNKLCAQYRNRKMFVSDLLTKINNTPNYHKEKIADLNSLKIAAEGFIVQDIMLEIAESNKYEKEYEFKDKFTQMINNLYLKYKKNDIAQKTVVSDSALKKFYNENIDFFYTDNQINVQEIIVKDKSFADQLVQRIKAGEDFGKLAQQYSIRTWTAANNGEIGFAPFHKFGIFQSIFWDAQVGAIIGPHKFDDYYGIFKILGKRERELFDFDSIKDEVSHFYRENNQSELLFQHIEKLHKQVEVFIDTEAVRLLNIEMLSSI